MSFLRHVGFGSLSGVAAAVVLVLIVLPLLAVLAQAVFPALFAVPPSLTLQFGGVRTLLADPFFARAAVDSVALALACAAFCVLLGIAVAYLLELTDLPGRGLWNGLVWLVFLSPSFLIAQGWELLIAPGGLLSHALGGIPGQLLLTPLGVGAVLSLKLFPFATFSAAGALRGLGQDVWHAARASGAGPWLAWRRILLPLLFPAMAAGGLIVFAEVLGDFGVASTLAQSANFPLTTYAIYAALEQFPVNFSGAAAASWVLVAAVGVAQILQSRAAGRRGFATRRGGTRDLTPQPLGPRRPWVVGGMVLLMALALGVPAGATVLASFSAQYGGGLLPGHYTVHNYVDAWQVPYGLSGFLRSLGYGAGSATLGMVLGLVLTVAWRRRGSWLAAGLQNLLLASIAVPGIVLGAGYIFFWNQPALAHLGLALYGTPLCLLLAYTAGGLPYAWRIASGSVAQVPETAVAAARAAGATMVGVLRRIYLPMLSDTWGRVWLLLFAGVVFELPVSELLYPPGGPVLSVAIEHQMGNTSFGTGAAVTVVATAAVGVLAAAIGVARHRLAIGRSASANPGPTSGGM